MTATTEQLLALLRLASVYMTHHEECEWPPCSCGWKQAWKRVEDALANHPPERPESSTCLPRRAIKVVNTGKDDGDDDGN